MKSFTHSVCINASKIKCGVSATITCSALYNVKYSFTFSRQQFKYFPQVAWMKSDSRAILAIHTHLIAHNPRLSVTHNGHNTWKLHVSNVQKNDSGAYMCQINTEPMQSQVSENLST